MNRYIAIDVETPNSRNDRISAIGISVVEGMEIVDEYYYLVNPETHFDRFNIELTDITPEMVADKPNFAQLWETIEPIIDSGLIIAHYAPFDMGVLAKCLSYYGLSRQRSTSYACTCQMGKACLPFLPNHKLNTLCDYLGFDLNHHNAGSDSHACALLLCYYLKKGIDVNRYIRRYSI